MSKTTSIHRREAIIATGGLFTVLLGCTSQRQQVGEAAPGSTSTLDEQAIRKANIATLKELGFSVAEGLPNWSQWSGKPIALRPKIEICRRLMCSEVATAYIWSPDVPEEKLRAYIKRSSLMDSMTEVERRILGTARDQVVDAFGDSDGWRQENQWALAWVLGFEMEPGLRDGFINKNVLIPLVQDFMPSLEETDRDFAGQARLRSLAEVFRKFDLFYCAHNAVRSAQLGRKTVPAGFDPLADGGVVHEKRHSFTWCLSPGVEWDDTDLAT